MTTLPYNPVTATLQAIAACLCAEIQNPDNGVPDVCYCGVVPGDLPPAVYSGNCKIACGMAWVRLVSLYPSNTVGAALQDMTRCDSGYGIDIEIGVLRCMSVGDERGNLPSAQEQQDAFALQMADALIMWRALVCCPAVPHPDLILGTYQPLGPEGGLVGGSYNASMGIV